MGAADSMGDRANGDVPAGVAQWGGVAGVWERVAGDVGAAVKRLDDVAVL